MERCCRTFGLFARLCRNSRRVVRLVERLCGIFCWLLGYIGVFVLLDGLCRRFRLIDRLCMRFLIYAWKSYLFT